MYDLDKIHRKNPSLKLCRHELIWDILGKYKTYIRINTTKAEFIPFSIPLDINLDYNKINYIFTYIQRAFQNLYFYEKRGILESLYLIEKQLQRDL